jgi:16S rRNA G966 N2-methylase RsmD
MESYPLYKNYYTFKISKINNLISKFDNIIHEQKPNYIKNFIQKINLNNKHQFLLIEEKWETNEELNLLTDYFTEDVRIKCNFKNNLSPLDYFNANYNKINNIFHLDNVDKNNKIIDFDIIKFKDYMFYNSKFCNNFRISVALSILNIFKPKSWLDISAGWGDRLISAILFGIDEYFGVDPNIELQDKYKNIINTLVDKNKQNNFKIIKSGFENAIIPNRKYDIVFSSPPFFDTEIYTNDIDDSLIKNNTIEKWYNDFLLFSVYKAIEYLNIDGHLVLYIDFTDKEYINRMIYDISKKINYLGNIYYFNSGKNPKLRTFYVWKK